MYLFEELFKKVEDNYDIIYDKFLIRNQKGDKTNVDNIDFNEKPNLNKLAFLLCNLKRVEELYREDAHNQVSLEKYYNAWNEDLNCVLVKYTQTTGLNGRYQAEHSLSGQGMVREARHIIYDEYTDIDMKNAHPNIILWICDYLNALYEHNGDKIKIDCEKLREYINDRDNKLKTIVTKAKLAGKETIKRVKAVKDKNGEDKEEMQEITIDTSYVKTYILKIMYGCGEKAINELCKEAREGFLEEMIKENKQIAHKLYYIFKPFSERCIERRVSQEKDYNHESGTLSHLCQYVENQLLLRMLQILVDNVNEERDAYKTILCFDGLMIHNDCFTKIFNKDSFIRKCKELIHSYDFPSFDLSIKEMDLADKVFNSLKENRGIEYDPQTSYIDKYLEEQSQSRKKKLYMLINLNKHCDFNTGPVYDSKYDWTHEENIKQDFAEFDLMYGEKMEAVHKNSKKSVIKTRLYFEDFYNKLTKTKWESLGEAILFFKAYKNRFMVHSKPFDSRTFIINNSSTGITYERLGEDMVQYKAKNKKEEVVNIQKPFKDFVFQNAGCINEISKYSSMCFIPYTQHDNNALLYTSKFNKFSGFQAKLHDKNYMDNLSTLEQESLTMILDHINLVLANNDSTSFTFIKSWLHMLFKKPSIKTKKVMIFQSDKNQCGKGIIINSLIGKLIMGPRLYRVHNGLGFLAQKFNGFLEDSLYHVIEELRNIDSTKNKDDVFNSLKTFTADDTIMIERKTIDAYQADNYCNFIANTNSTTPVKIESGDARLVLFKCNESLAGNTGYFDNFVKKCLNQKAADLFYSYIYWLGEDEVVDVRESPETELYKEIKRNTMTSSLAFLQDIKETLILEPDEAKWSDLHEDVNKWKEILQEKITTSDGGKRLERKYLYESYQSWCKTNGELCKSKRYFYGDIKDKIEMIKSGNFYFILSNIKTLC